MDSNTARNKALAAVQSIFDRYHVLVERVDYHGIDLQLMSDLKLVDAEPEGGSAYELEVTEAYSNLRGVMHGGATALIFDMCTTTALGPIARPGYWYFLGGVTRTLNVSYLKAIPVGTTIQIRSHVIQHGRTMALIKGAMTSLDGRITYATVEHHKVNVSGQEEEMAASVASEGEKGQQWRQKETKARL